MTPWLRLVFTSATQELARAQGRVFHRGNGPDASISIYIYIDMFWHSATSLWLVETSSQAGHVFCRHNKVRPQHRELRAYSFRTVHGFFYVPQNYEQWRTARRGLRFYRPCPRRLASQTICRCNYKGSTFCSVIDPEGSNPRPAARLSDTQLTELIGRRGQGWNNFFSIYAFTYTCASLREVKPELPPSTAGIVQWKCARAY